jgi:hypothetical protein
MRANKVIDKSSLLPITVYQLRAVKAEHLNIMMDLEPVTRPSRVPVLRLSHDA